MKEIFFDKISSLNLGDVLVKIELSSFMHIDGLEREVTVANLVCPVSALMPLRHLLDQPIEEHSSSKPREAAPDKALQFIEAIKK